MSYTSFDPFQCDPPICPVDEVADDWHRLCDLIARNPLVNRVECPGRFDIRLARRRWEWEAVIELGQAADCVSFGGVGDSGWEHGLLGLRRRGDGDTIRVDLTKPHSAG